MREILHINVAGCMYMCGLTGGRVGKYLKEMSNAMQLAMRKHTFGGTGGRRWAKTRESPSNTHHQPRESYY